MFNRYTDELQAFQLAGDRYTKLQLREPKLWIQSLQLGLGLWEGTYQNIERQWLRWYDAAGNWVMTPAEQEAQQVNRERQRVARLVEQL